MEWFDIRGRSSQTFQWYLGGRGIGKTYSALSLFLDINECGLYLRTTQREIEACASEEGNPFKKLNTNLGRHLEIDKMSKGDSIASIWEEDIRRGYAAALSTFARGLRSVDLSDVTFIIYDEVVSERHLSKTVKESGEAFANLYEGINRNRELEGKPPVRVYFLSNSISLDNDVMLSQGVVPIVQMMIRKNQKKFSDPSRGISVDLCPNRVSEAKKETAIYKLMKGTAFYDQAIGNEFTNDRTDLVISINNKEWIPLVKFDDIVILKHKSDGRLYVKRKGTAPRVFKRDQVNSFKLNFIPSYRLASLEDRIYFETYELKLMLDKILGMN